VVENIQTAMISLWGDDVGAVSWLEDRGVAVFEYEPSFLQRGLDLSPIHLGLDEARRGNGIFSFPGLNRDTFLGLPGLLADSLPDKFGNSIIDAWLARNGWNSLSFSPVERLCYTSNRGMGALEFSPPIVRRFDQAVPVEIAELVVLAQEIISHHQNLDVAFGSEDFHNSDAIMDILRVGTSAGGARPKAIIAMDTDGNVMSGQGKVPEDYSHWLIKFDGVDDSELGEPKGYGRIEYAYSLMAQEAGITMSECQLLEEGGRAHFLTKRFDREDGEKIHMQSLCGVAHYDFNFAGAYSYEQAFSIMRQLRLTKVEAIQQYRRMVFNVVARNQDDHTKNIAFLMSKSGKWRLSPAFDVTYSHNPARKWTDQHQMTINGKRDHFAFADLVQVGEAISIAKLGEIIEHVVDAVAKWPDFAKEAGIDKKEIQEKRQFHRLNFA
jgi:serine/threonine-protein kinase HipA